MIRSFPIGFLLKWTYFQSDEIDSNYSHFEWVSHLHFVYEYTRIQRHYGPLQ